MDDGTNNLTLEKIFTILVNDVGGETGTEINNAENGLRIYPNPFNLITTIEFPNPEQSEYSFSVTDLAGRVVYVHGKINTCAIEFNRNDLPAGVYFIELRGDKIYRAKLVIE